MIRPTTRLVILLLAWLLLAVAAAFVPALVKTWVICAALLAAALVLDGIWVRQLKQIEAERKVNHNLPINSWSDVKLRLRHHHRRTLHMTLHDHVPNSFRYRQQPQPLSLPTDKMAEISYPVKPQQRGNARFAALDLLITSPFGLWRRRLLLPLESTVRVYPNFAEISHYTLLATDNRLSQMGVKRRQRRGEGNDFHQLREYRDGDSLKQVDWKATARHRKVISREYQDERDQQILFMVDCGRRMRHKENGQEHLDQALNAMLLLSYVAVRQGDAAGFISFAGDERWCAPQKGQGAVNQLLNQTFDLPSTMDAADYLGTARRLMSLQRRRSLIVLMTNTRDEDQQELLTAVQLLSRRHLVVLADLQEPALQQSIEQDVNTLDSALQYHSVYDYLQRRRSLHESLGHSGALCMDTTAEQLPVKLVNQYLDIKRAGRL
ncbi:DUF58 domain-containing protein [Porticoccus sp. W117]|uniref:DUF58 domain-containing protein n=1 Tax=Porticoccus sp. W117 TaxID=3054777 RepID=UPI002598F1F3|nr:DUF58 domain-containing protein [Porticoccus sp. W117]MDM3871369.1 DUF58 domain-containing protein [Porticoccus sp. W117]